MLYLIFIIIIVISSLAFYIWKSTRRYRVKRLLKKNVLKIIDQRLRCLDEVKILGVGNVGVVVAAKLSPGWEKQLGISWKSPSDLPSTVSVKIADFRNSEERKDLLCRIASEMYNDVISGKIPPICPFFAIGSIPDFQGMKKYLVEVMPYINGENLSDKLKMEKFKLDYAVKGILSILKTVLYLEKKGYYSRNVDVENVIVRPDGKWLRIDFDNAVDKKEFPIRRMIRIARFCVKVLERVDNNDTISEILKKIRITENAPLKSETSRNIKELQKQGIITTPDEMIKLLESCLENYSENS
jgi:serine/threonine protein kinase